MTSYFEVREGIETYSCITVLPEGKIWLTSGLLFLGVVCAFKDLYCSHLSPLGPPPFCLCSASSLRKGVTNIERLSAGATTRLLARTGPRACLPWWDRGVHGAGCPPSTASGVDQLCRSLGRRETLGGTGPISQLLAVHLPLRSPFGLLVCSWD